MEDDRRRPRVFPCSPEFFRKFNNMFSKQPIQQQETEMETKQTNAAGTPDGSVVHMHDTPTRVQRERTLEVVVRRQWPSTSTGTIERLCFEDYQSCHYQDGMFWVYFGERRCRTFRQEDVFSFEAFPASEGRYRGLKAQEDEEAKNSAPFKEKGYVVLAQGGIQLPRPAIEVKVEGLEKRVSDLEEGLNGKADKFNFVVNGGNSRTPGVAIGAGPAPQGGAPPALLTREESIEMLRAFDIDNPRVHEAIGVLTREPQLDPPLNKTIWLWDDCLQGWYLGGLLTKPRGEVLWLPYDAIEQPKGQQ